MLAMLTNGTDTIYLANLAATQGAQFESGCFPPLREPEIPHAWSQATLKISSHTNSTVGTESVDFDNIFFTGIRIPEPSTTAMLLTVGIGLAWQLRRRKRMEKCLTAKSVDI